MAKLLVVLGATGLQGGSVITTYLQNDKNKKAGEEWKIRAITRDPSKPAAKKLEEQGVQVVKADLNDVDSLVAAFEGANMIFAVTDFWAPFFSPSTASKLAPHQTKNQYCYALEVAQGHNIATAASAPSVLPTLSLLIWSSLVDTSKWSGGKYTWNYHFDGKAHIWDHILAEKPELAKKTSLLFMGSYMSNAESPVVGLGLRKRVIVKERGQGKEQEKEDEDEEEQEEFVLTQPHGPDVTEPFVDTVSDTGRFVAALEGLGAGKKLFGVSDMRSCGDFVRVWSATTGRRARVEQVSREEYVARVAKVDEALAVELADSRGFNEDFGWTGGEEGVLMPKDLGIKTTTIEEYTKRTDWSPLIGSAKQSLL